MNTFTIQIQASNADGTIWQALAPARFVETDDTAAEVAREAAAHQSIADGSNWRVQVWEGVDIDVEPVAELVAGTSVDDLARAIAERHGIDSITAARESVVDLVDQIVDDGDLWDGDTETLTPAGVDLVTWAADESYSVGAVATRAAQILVELEETVAEAGRLTDRRDDLVRAALATELRREDIAAAAGLTPARLYQIRDSR